MSSAPPALAASTNSIAPRRGLSWWMIGLVAVLAFGVYASSLRNQYAFDDVGIVQNSAHVVNLEWTAIWSDNYWPMKEGVQPDALYRPLTLWSYLANQAIAPDVAWPFHLVNVLLHTLVSVQVMLLAWRLLADRAVALVAGILFAVHPLHTEVVANIVGRAELLATAWSLLALLLYLPEKPAPFASVLVIAPRRTRVQLACLIAFTVAGGITGARIGSDPVFNAIAGAVCGLAAGLLVSLAIGCVVRGAPVAGIRPWWHGGLVALCFAAALLSKETPASLVFGFVLIDAWRFSQSPRTNQPAWYDWLCSQAVRCYAPVSLAVGIYTLARIHACGLMSRASMIHRIVNPLVDASPLERIITPFMLLAKYIQLLLWPVHLSADYSAPSLMPSANPLVGTAFQPPAIFGMLVCVLLITLAIYFWKKHPQILLLAGLALVSYILVANVVRIGTIFGERLFYWPSAFVLILLAWPLVALYRGIRARLLSASGSALLSNAASSRKWTAAACAMIALFTAAVGLMGVRTWQRNPDWANNTALAISTARDNPMSGKACCWAGAILVNTDNVQYQEFGRSLIERSIELTPDFVNARWEIAKYYGLRGQLGPSAVLIAQAARRDPGSLLTRSAVPALIEDLRKAQPDQYMPYIEDFQKNHPDDEAGYFALACAYHAQGQWDLAEQMAYKAINIGLAPRPGEPKIFHEAGAELAAIRFDRGEIVHAIATMRTYVQNFPNSVEGHCEFASMLLALDPKQNPGAVYEAQANLDIADMLTPGDSHVRTVRGQLGRLKSAVSRGLPIPSDIPVPRVTVAVEPESEMAP